MQHLTQSFQRLLIVAIGIFFTTNSIAANRYWIGGTGKWSETAHWSSTSGGATCSCTPTSTDNVHFDANSFSGNAQTVTIDVNASCNNMDWSAITKTSIQMSGSSNLHIYGSLTLNSTMLITNFTGYVYFDSNNPGNTITLAGKAFSSYVYFNGTGGEWTLQDAFSTTSEIDLNNGTLYTNNKNITCNTFYSNNSNVRGLDLGTSTITLNYYWSTGGNNFAFDAGTSLIKLTGSYSTPSVSGGINDGFYDVLFQGANINSASVSGGLSFHNVTFPAVPATISGNNGTTFHKAIFGGDGTINGNTTYDSLLFAAGHTYTLAYNKTQTINNYLKADGTCNAPIILRSSSAGTQATISSAASAITVSYLQIQDINATGAATFTANYTSDLGNNAGFTMTSSATDLYWIGGNGNWNAPDHWSATSGGAAACIIPNPSTNVHFDANSFSGNAQTVTLNVTGYCNSMDWSTITKTSIQLSGSSNLHIYGSLTMKSTMVITNYTGYIYFESNNPGNTITSAGKVFNKYVYFDGAGGEWTLQDAFNTTSDINLNFGTLNTNNKNITCNTFYSNNSNVRGLNLGTSTITINYYWSTAGNNFTFDAGTSLIKLTGSYSTPSLSGGVNDVFNDVLFQGPNVSSASVSGGLSFHNVTFPAVPATISGNNGTSFHKAIFGGDGTLNGNTTYDSLFFAAGHSYTLAYNKTQTINNYLKADGTCNAPIILHSSNAGSQATISSAANAITVSYLQIQDINATGGATFTANYTSDLGNNAGFTLTASATDLYWIGGTGNWNASNHWSKTSGGASACVIPNSSTNVHFDANSFSGNSQTVTINVTAYCNNMDWSSITKTSIQMGGSADLHIYGSLTMKSTMIITNNSGYVYFDSNNPGNTITSAGKIFTNYVYFNGTGGEWTLQDAFNTTSTITHNNGTLYTNNKNLTCNTFYSNNNNVRGLNLGTSTITINYYWSTGGNNFAFDAGTSLIKLTGSYSTPSLSGGINDGFYDVLFQGANISSASITGGLSFNNVTFPAVPATISGNNGTSFHKATFGGDGTLNGNTMYDSLFFAAGHTYTLQYNKTQTFNNYLKADGTCTSPIILRSSSAGTQATISSAASAIVNYAQIKDIKTAGASFTANNSTDNGNNTGWTISTSSPVAAFTTLQSGLSSTFSNTSTGATAYQWNFGDGNTSVSSNPLHTYNFGGNYNVCLIAANSCGVNNDTLCHTVNAGCSVPVANFAMSVNGLKVTFANSSTNAASILWKFGDATSSTSFNPVHTFFNGGTYAVCLYISNGCGLDSLCQNVTVTCSPPTTSYNYAVNGMTANFTNVSTNAASSLWNFGDGQLSTQGSTSHIYNTAGTYTVKLNIANGCGKDSMTQSVTVICAAPVASLNINQNGLAVDFVSTSSDATSVSWNFGDNNNSTLPVVNHTYATTGTYTVCLTANNGCGNNSHCIPISVCAAPVANFTETTSALNASFTNTSTNAINYYWTFDDAGVSNASNSVSPTHIYSASGIHNVCLSASNSCGTDTVCKEAKVLCTTITDQSICLVTVDALSKYNVILWSKPAASSIDSFIVYREISTNNYQPIGAVPYDSLSLFIDTVGTKYFPNTGNPNKGTYRYKIALKDTCGNNSEMSNYHNSIYISNNNGTFSWNSYTIENTANPVTNYVLMRDDLSNGSWHTVSSVSGTQQTITDPDYSTFQNTASWRVSTQWSINCTATKSLNEGKAISSESNVYTKEVYISVNSLENNSLINIYPNPNNGLFNVQMSESEKVLPIAVEFQICDVLGNIIYQNRSTSSTLQIDLSDQAEGVYFISIKTNQGTVNKKIVISK